MADYKKSSVHCHSTMCDGKNTLQEMASAACAKGLTTLGFTGHSYTQRDREYCMSPSRTAQYKATIAKLKTEYKGKVDILCGIEWDLLSEDKRTGYDYWIGSAHHLYGKNTGKYYEIDWRESDLAACIRDDFDGDGLAVAEAYFANVAKVAEKHPNADRILRLEIDFGEGELRQILSGLAEHYAPEDLVGKRVCAVLNLAPRKIRGLVSHGMVLTAGTDSALGLLAVDRDVPDGSEIA